jgi:hypothetical protein
MPNSELVEQIRFHVFDVLSSHCGQVLTPERVDGVTSRILAQLQEQYLNHRPDDAP